MARPKELTITVGEKINLGNYQTANLETTVKFEMEYGDKVVDKHLEFTKTVKDLNDKAKEELYPRNM